MFATDMHDSDFPGWEYREACNASRMQLEREGAFDDDPLIEDYRRQGYWVFVKQEEVLCRITDATLGYVKEIFRKPDGQLAIFQNHVAAENWYAAWATGEYGISLLAPIAPPRPAPASSPPPKLPNQSPRSPKKDPKPRNTDVVRGGQNVQPQQGDAVLGRSSQAIRAELYELCRKGGTAADWQKLANLDVSLFSEPQSKARPYLEQWKRNRESSAVVS